MHWGRYGLERSGDNATVKNDHQNVKHVMINYQLSFFFRKLAGALFATSAYSAVSFFGMIS